MVALSRNVPRKQAMEMLLTGDPIDAQTAFERGTKLLEFEMRALPRLRLQRRGIEPRLAVERHVEGRQHDLAIDLVVATDLPGAIFKQPAVITGPDGEDVIAVRSLCYLPLTYDHRLVDGADAGRFVSAIRARLEEGAFETELGL